jgi:ankyrin repeat protein
MCACAGQQHWIQIAKLLIATSRKLLDDEDSLGRTPLKLASELESTDMVACLQKKVDEIRSMKIKAEEKRIKNKPKVRRLGE